MNALEWGLTALGRGTDVYLFLIGMMALAAYAQIAGIFDWIAARAVGIAGPSRFRLFALVYVAGIGTTAFLSNDATIVALTPAVISALRRYDAVPLPYVVACALVANAASFLLPISNPSNLLVFAGRMPSLEQWLHMFTLSSVGAIVATFAIIWWIFRRELCGEAARVDVQSSTPAFVAIVLVTASAAIVVATSALGGWLGAATFGCGAVVWLVTAIRDRAGAATIVREISWRIVALTAALFVIVSALDDAGGFNVARTALAWCANHTRLQAGLTTGFLVAVASNLINNLPVGLNIGETLPAMNATLHTSAAALVGVNLGPNATVNGSLATLLWLRIVRRAGISISPLAFARIGLLATAPALAIALVLI